MKFGLKRRVATHQDDHKGPCPLSKCDSDCDCDVTKMGSMVLHGILPTQRL